MPRWKAIIQIRQTVCSLCSYYSRKFLALLRSFVNVFARLRAAYRVLRMTQHYVHECELLNLDTRRMLMRRERRLG